MASQCKRDPEMHQEKKGKQWPFGMTAMSAGRYESGRPNRGMKVHSSSGNCRPEAAVRQVRISNCAADAMQFMRTGRDPIAHRRFG